MTEQITSNDCGTFFAPAERDSDEIAGALMEKLQGLPHLQQFLEAFQAMTVILGKNRQIVMHNMAFLNAIPASKRENLFRLRPGEAVNCIEADLNPSGCGTGKQCRTCGAVLAILDAQGGQHSVRECTINATTEAGEPLNQDLRAEAAPIQVEGEELTLVSFSDISSEAAKELLDRAFIHDIMNTASNLHQILELYHSADADDRNELVGDLDHVSHQLVTEISHQRDLVAAQRGELHLNLSSVAPRTILDRVAISYRNSRLLRSRHLRIELTEASEREIVTDPIILARVLGNLTKNALEASHAEGEVLLWVETLDDDVRRFCIHNEIVIAEKVRSSIFKQGVSTKGYGRGIGLYSAALFVTQHLQGELSFITDEVEGTTFIVEIPTTIGTAQK